MTIAIPGGYGCIVADPPWSFRAGRATRIRPRYRCMSDVQIASLPVREIAATRALLFLWVTSAHLETGFHIARRWGFEPKTTIVWIKMGAAGRLQIGMGSYVRCAHEIVIVCARGKQTGIDRSVPSVIIAPRGEHSRKPEALQDYAERLAPGPYCELFARRVRGGWTCWGEALHPTTQGDLQNKEK